MDNVTHGRFMLLLQASGVDAATVDRLAKGIHDSYMREWGGFGAFTEELIEVVSGMAVGTNAEPATPWTHVVRYFGPTGSVEWLQRRLETDFREAGGTVRTQTFTFRDITGRY